MGRRKNFSQIIKVKSQSEGPPAVKEVVDWISQKVENSVAGGLFEAMITLEKCLDQAVEKTMANMGKATSSEQS